MDDLTLALRKRKSKTESAENPGGQAVPQPAAKQSKTSGATQEPAHEQPAPCPEEEIDIGNDEGCVQYIVASFPACDSDTVQPVAEHYVASLKSKICKGNPLWSVFNKEVIKGGLLSSKAGRKAWLSAHKSNREQRFVKAPKPTKT